MGKRQSDLPSEFVSMDELLLRTLPVPISKACREGTNLRSPVCYIYTSGTTGALVHFPLYMETNTNHSVSKNVCITCVYFQDFQSLRQSTILKPYLARYTGRPSVTTKTIQAMLLLRFTTVLAPTCVFSIQLKEVLIFALTIFYGTFHVTESYIGDLHVHMYYYPCRPFRVIL